MPRHVRAPRRPRDDVRQLLRRDAALLPRPGGDPDRPVRAQQRRALEQARLRVARASPTTCSRSGSSGPATRRRTSASSSTATRARSTTRTTSRPGWDRWSVEVGNGRGYYDFKLSVDGKQRKEQLQGRVPDRRPQRARERVPRGDVRRAAVLPPALAVGAARREHQREQRRPLRRPGGAAAPRPRPLRRHPRCRGSRACSRRTSPTSRRSSAASRRSGPSSGRSLRDRYQCKVETLPAVDRGIASLVETLRREGELDDTIIVFSSDNGTFQGQHRLPGGKGLAYDEAAHLPLVIRAPAKYTGGAEPPLRVDELVSNIDYAPTVVDWSGTETCPAAGECRVMDGLSWLPLLAGRPQEWPADRAVATELRLNNEAVQPDAAISCAFEGVRQDRWLYIRHTSLPDLATWECIESDVGRALRPRPRSVRARERLRSRRPARAPRRRGAARGPDRRARRLRRDRGARPRARVGRVVRRAAGHLTPEAPRNLKVPRGATGVSGPASSACASRRTP